MIFYSNDLSYLLILSNHFLTHHDITNKKVSLISRWSEKLLNLIDKL